jgi:hypothetical protein
MRDEWRRKNRKQIVKFGRMLREIIPRVQEIFFFLVALGFEFKAS